MMFYVPCRVRPFRAHRQNVWYVPARDADKRRPLRGAENINITKNKLPSVLALGSFCIMRIALFENVASCKSVSVVTSDISFKDIGVLLVNSAVAVYV